MNYYERHLGDYARDTGHLSLMEHGAYTLLLDRYYATEQPIPSTQAHRLARARSKDEIKAVDDVLAEFFTLEDGLWVHGRCDAEIHRKETKTKAARENGRNGGRPKKKHVGSENETQEKPTGLLLGSENETQEKPSEKLTSHQTPVTSNTPIPPAKTPGVDERFERFWQAYPKKVGKDAARKSFEKRKPDEKLLVAMLSTLAVQTHSPQWTKDAGQFIPNPATWLNQGRWQDGAAIGYEMPSMFAGGI